MLLVGGVLLAGLSCTSEYLYSFNGKLEGVRLAEVLFPLDVRFRGVDAELAMRSPDDAWAIKVLEQYKLTDPWNVGVRDALVIHKLRVGDQRGFAAELAALATFAPHTELVRKFLPGLEPK